MFFFFSYHSPNSFPNFLVPPPYRAAALFASVPAERDVSRPVPALLHQRLVEFPSGPRMDGRPAVLTVVLQTGHVGAKERSELPPTASALTFITQLVIQDIWLHFHLEEEGN